MNKQTNISLQIRILAGYIILIVVIAGMTSILLHERDILRRIETESEKIRSVRRDINTAHRHITKLATLGESVIAWEETDYEEYGRNRLLTDSLLQTLKPHCREYVQPSQIDTLRHLLAEKETHLLHIMQNIKQQKEREEMLSNQLPEVAKRATRVRTIEKKKKGIAGFFGKKEEIQVMPSTKELHAFSDSLIAMQQRQAHEMDTYTDSLRMRNKELNKALNRLIGDLDRQAYFSFSKREQKIESTRNESFRLLAITLSVAVILLCLSYLTIHRELKRNIRAKIRREELIGKLQESNEANEKLIKLRRNLIQNITHELRTPLTAIVGNAELLPDDTEAHNRIRHAQTIREAAGRMAGMINSLLVYFRLDSGKETPSVKPFRLYSIAETLETEFAQQTKGKRLSFTVKNRADEIVNGDRNRILSIGSNLLSNAIKFTQSGTITLSADYKNGIFTLLVEDTGTGMTEEQQQRIFIPFERLGNAVTEDGFGLGLAIVADTVKLLKGNVTVESEPGKGSRFTVSLPLPKTEESPETEKTGMSHSSLSGCSVLAIDNNEMLLGLMKDMYRQHDMECDTCHSVAELTDRIRMKDYDLLITDLKMPEMNGYEVLELLRSSEIGNSRTIPVVAATAAGYVTEKELKEKGFAALLPKPYSIGELLAVTENCVMQKEANSINLSPLLAFGDKRHTLERLATMTQADMDGVRTAVESKDMEALDGWVHHLRSSWMLIKAEQPLAVLYEVIHRDEVPEKELSDAIGKVLAQGKAITDLARKEAERWEG